MKLRQTSPKIDCFFPIVAEISVAETVSAFHNQPFIENIFGISVKGRRVDAIDGMSVIETNYLYGSSTIRLVAKHGNSDFCLFSLKPQPIELGFHAMERLLNVVEDTQTDMVYADHYRIIGNKSVPHPVIDYQVGSLRDDFDFGSLVLIRMSALKAYVGSSLPDGDFRMPLTTGVSVERQLGKRLSLEAGLQYNRLHDVALPEGSHTYHTLSIPVRLNVNLAGNDKVDLYAMAGGSVEKCVAGAENNSFGAEPLQLAALAGVGVRYKLNDRFALFAEPMLTYHFDTDSSTRTLRTERPANFNLLCGVRMTY